ncbi:diguanylate cyclase [Priestia taiwanensis]|uniref:Diguanylate cyclase n=2 Tax=Priestia taiwanensis TaxID=1347902 RepID=A0A917EQY1_9BACI|nr:diguanylate cyclase [Priestia taiwanensis]
MAFGITMEFGLETIFSLLSVEHFRVIPYILYMCVYAYIILWINFDQHEKKQMVRFMLDILVVFVTVFALGYQFFIHPLLDQGKIHKVDIIGVIYLLLDIGMLCAIFACFVLKIYKKLSRNIVLLLTTAFVLQLTMNGMNMYVFFFHGKNIWHYVSPVIMITGMLLLLCVEIHIQDGKKGQVQLFSYERIQKMEYIYSYIFYFLCSITLFVAFLHTGEKLTVSSISFGVVLMIMLMRQMLIVIEKEELLQNVHQMNGELQELVQERTNRLEVSENRDKSLFQNYPNPTFYLDVKGNILQRNKAAEEITSKKMNNINEFIAEKMMFQNEEDINNINNKILSGSLTTFDFSMYDSELQITRYFSITSIPIRIKRKLKGMYVILKEITQTIVQEKQIYELAHYDTLTKLANRRTFDEKLAAHIRLANEDEHSVAVMFIDLDRFKIVNDTLGHHVGDELLKEVAKRLLLAVDSSALVARLGGDEFTVLFYNFEEEADLARISKNILAVFENPVIIQQQVLKVTLSIGVAIHEKGMDGATLMKNADSAMYYVKAKGKNNYQIYDESIAYHYQRQFKIEKDLYKAIEHNQLTLYYQPQYCMRKKTFVGLEALVRWKHPSLGIISPADFIPIAEETGLIVNMGEWIIRESCKRMKELLNKGYKVTKMCVNISKKQLEKEGFVERIATIFEEIGIAPTYIEFELTESILLIRDNELLQRMEKLKNLGISIAIDDFGTGYSSLSYLPNFSFDTLKLAREMIEGIEENEKRATVVEAVLDLAHLLGCKTIVEGIETESQATYFQDKCHYMQGYYLSKPLPPEAVETFLEECHFAVK